MTESSYFKQILVPVDGSPSSLQAQEAAADIAKKFGSKVLALHVIPHGASHQATYWNREGHGIPETARREMESMVLQSGEQALSGAKMLFKAENIQVEAILEEFADPAETILDIASERKPDLIVLGNRGSSEIEDFDLGGVAEKVSRHAQCPVLIVKKTSPFLRILVAHDGSKDAVKALECAVQIGQRNKSVVTLLNVAQARLPLMKPDAAKSLGQRIVSEAEKQAGGVSLDKKVEVGHPAKTIIDFAKKGKYDLIVVGGRGMNPARRFFLGSVSDNVARHASCSVMIAR